MFYNLYTYLYIHSSHFLFHYGLSWDIECTKQQDTVLSSRTLFIHPIYNSSHLLIPNFQSVPAPQPSPWKSQKTYSNINMYFLIFKLSLYPSSSLTHISVLIFLGVF